MEFCNACSVRQECLEYAIKEDIRVGIYGGTTWRQRKMMKINKNKRKALL
jgi:WhiB family redox-sensing transcriptional regulator